MALLAEQLVDEWLNRQGFFTIRGLKQGHDEIDLLGVKSQPNAKPLAWHVEVQVSMRPVNHIASLTDELMEELSKAKGAAVKRTDQQMDDCVEVWVNKKFKSEKKIEMREALWPGLDWKFFLVHGVIKFPAELVSIEKRDVTIKPIKEVLNELCLQPKPTYTTSSGGDFAELINYFSNQLL